MKLRFLRILAVILTCVGMTVVYKAAASFDGLNPPHAVDTGGKAIPESSATQPDKPFILAKDFSIFSAILWSGCNMKVTRATGSLMTTNDFGCSEVARGPNPVSAISLRMRPWLSRKTLVCVFRVM